MKNVYTFSFRPRWSRVEKSCLLKQHHIHYYKLMYRVYTFYVYILTNPAKTVLYIGQTNNLARRLNQHLDSRGDRSKFAGRFYCNNLIYYEIYKYVNKAIARERQLKRWSRSKKENLIATINPSWHSLNSRFYGGD